MCSGKRTPPTMDGGDMTARRASVLLELAASDDLEAFKAAVEEQGHGVDEPGMWYGRRIGSKKMSFEERTPIMIAAMFGSKAVLGYIIGTGSVDVNAVHGSDKATALHCAAAGASAASAEVVELLLAASADADSVDANGNRPGDLVSPPQRRRVRPEAAEEEEEEEEIENSSNSNSSSPRRREFPVDLSLPDIKNGIYSTDDFRMYTFKVKPCSRAYSHDWTECPFVHPGENARRRDPRKYHYSCVPCPEFRKGACRQGDACEYAHGIFECWLHPAQYRTRLCKDETGCQRRVCFFAHKPDELRPLYASTGSAVPPPPTSPIALRHSPPPPPLQLPGSRLKGPFDFDVELLGAGLEGYRLSSPSTWSSGHGSHNNIDEIFAGGSQLQSPIRQSCPIAVGAASPSLMSSRAAAFAQRSQSFIDRSAVNRHPLFSSHVAGPRLSDWGSPDGKLDWAMPQGEELSKLRKSASLRLRSVGNYSAAPAACSMPAAVDEPDVSWVQSLVVDPQPVKPTTQLFNGVDEQHQCHFDAGVLPEMIPAWVEQMYMEQEQLVA